MKNILVDPGATYDDQVEPAAKAIEKLEDFDGKTFEISASDQCQR